MVLPPSKLSTASKKQIFVADRALTTPGAAWTPPRVRSHRSHTAGWDETPVCPLFPTLWHPAGSRGDLQPMVGRGEKRGRWKHTTAGHPLAKPPHLPSQMYPVPATATRPDGLSQSPRPQGHAGIVAAPSSHALKSRGPPQAEGSCCCKKQHQKPLPVPLLQ